LVLTIDEERYALLLQFLKTLDYVKITAANAEQRENLWQPGLSQLELLQQKIDSQTSILFSNIRNPVAWQKLQRDDWS
jgi:hypothetical protein